MAYARWLLVFAGLASLTSVGPLRGLEAQPTAAEAPVLRPGEFWIWRWEEEFRDRRSGTYRRTVVRRDTRSKDRMSTSCLEATEPSAS